MPLVTLHGLVEKTILQHGEHEAVRMDEGTISSRLTYRQLAQASQQVRNYLCRDGVRCEVVAVAMKPSLYHAAVCLGVMSVPAAFLPLEQNVPITKLIHLVKTLNIRALVVDSEFVKDLEEKLSFYVLRSQSLDDLHLAVVFLEDMKHRPWASPLAYVITTSGTTGLPKVVRVPHECILPNIQHICSLFDLKHKDVIFQASPLTFDPSVVETFCTLSVGACLLVVPEAMKHKGTQLMDCLLRNAVTVLQATPTLMKRMVPSNETLLLGPDSPLRILALGGEACPKRAVIRSWKHPENRTVFFNLYGITEVSCWATYCRIDVHSSTATDEVSLGEPLSDTVLDICDEEGHTIECGLGQLFIGGRHCLLDDDTSGDPGTMRNSGDIVLKDVNGTLWYRGRHDQQVKRHGKRLNLVEIELTVQGQCGVEQASCQLKKDVLWLVCQSPQTAHVLTPQIRDLLHRHFPPHYQPDRILCTPQAFPMTKHGKVDKENLLELALAEYEKSCNQQSSYMMTQLLQSLLSHCLGLPEDHQFSAGSKFLDIGGSSLLAVELSRRLQDELKTEVPGLLEVLFIQTLGQVEDFLSHCVPGSQTLPSTSQEGDSATSPITTEPQQSSDEDDGLSLSSNYHVSLNTSSGKPKDCDGTQEASLKRRGSPTVEELAVKKKPMVEHDATDGEDSQFMLANSSMGRPELSPGSGATNLKDYYCKYCQQIHSSRIAISLRRGCQRLVHRIKLEKRDWRAALFVMGNDMALEGRMGVSGRLLGDSASTGPLVDRVGVAGRSDELAEVVKVVSTPLSATAKRPVMVPTKCDPVSHPEVGAPSAVPDDQKSPAEDSIVASAVTAQAGTSVIELPDAAPVDPPVHSPDKSSPAHSSLVKIPDASQPMSHPRSMEGSHEDESGPESGVHAASRVTNGSEKAPPALVAGQDACELLSMWRYNTGKCVDASPTLLLLKNLGLVFIGSHSHEIAALHLESGTCLWVQTLPDRIESSAAISKCTTKIIVGCYDGSVYILDRFCGAIVWTVATGGAVKSSPTVDSVTGFIYVGSHDHHLYALAVQDCEVLWRRELDEGSVFASPTVCGQPHLVYAATLRGTLAAMQPLSGSVVWQQNVGAPMFASPAAWEKGVCVGCVDGTVRAFTHQGAKLWQYSTGGCVFSSPCLWKSRPLKYTVVVVGSHSNQVHCLSTRGQHLWTYFCTAPVYATPYVFKLPRPQECSNTMCSKPNGNLAESSDLNPSVKADTSGSEVNHTPSSPEYVEPLDLTNVPLGSSVSFHGRATSTCSTEEVCPSAISPPGSPPPAAQEVVAVCSTDGMVHVLRLDSGVNLARHALPGEVFSSPVCHQRKMVIGCRDDYVYCLQFCCDRL